MQKKKMAIIMTLILTVSIFFLIPRYTSTDDNYNMRTQTPTKNITDENNILPPAKTIVYNNILLIDQETEKLDDEAVQYMITFHGDDTVSYEMNMSYHLTKPGAVSYLIYLTDGNWTETLHLSDETYGSLVDSTTFIKHRKIGKQVSVNDDAYYQNTKAVKNNSVLYLTIAVKSVSNEESITVLFETEKNTMELTFLNRTNRVYLYSALNGDYKNGKIIGRYRGYALLGLGASHGSLSKNIPVINGGIICADMKNHYQGNIKVSTVSGSKTSESYEPDTASILVSTTDNHTGAWVVYANILGFPKKASLLTFVVDVNPYSSVTLNNWNGTKPITIEQRLDSLSAKMIQYGLEGLIKMFTRQK